MKKDISLQNKAITLAEHPDGKPTSETFELKEIATLKADENHILLKSLYVSVDPGMRGFMNKGDDDAAGNKFKLGEPITSRTVAQVIESHDADFPEGCIVHGRFPWQKFFASKADQLQKADEDLAPISTAVSILGIPGLAAYFGLLKIGQPQKNETVLVSGAAGGVGSLVVQIAKLKGCKVIGIAGSEEKITYLKNELGADDAINYKTTDSIEKDIKYKCPNGVDVFFDNVGGVLFEAVLGNINRHSRLVICGQIANYNNENPPTGPRPLETLIKKSAKIEGYVVYDYKDEFNEAKKEIAEWLSEDKIIYKENLIKGFENIPSAFIGLFKGQNIGKQMIKVAEPD